MTSSPQAEDRIVTLPDRYIPVYQVYFGRDASPLPTSGPPFPVPDTDPVTLTPGSASSSDPSAPPSAIETSQVYQTEAARIQARVVNQSSGPSQPAQGSSSGTTQLYPLAGPYGNKPGEQTNDVISVEFKEDIDGGLATVTVDLFNVYDFKSQTYRYTDPPAASPSTGPLIDYGVTIALFFGYQNAPPGTGAVLAGNVAPVFEGIVTKLDMSFPADGPSTVKITAVDKRDRSRGQKGLVRKPPFRNKTEEQIAASVAGVFGLKVAVRNGQSTPTVGDVALPPDQDAMVFLKDRATKAGLEMKCFGNIVFLTTPGDGSGQTPLRYDYRRGLSSFSVSIDGTGKPTSVMLTARNPKTQEKYTTTKTTKDLQDAGFAPPGPTVLDTIQQQGQAGNKQEVVTNYFATSQTDAENKALGILKRNLDGALKASGEVIGDPALRAGATLQIGGLGPHYSGPYYATSTTHTFGSAGYKTTFEARRNSAPGGTAST
jgi:phage protein D